MDDGVLGITSYLPDPANRLTSITAPGQAAITLGYDAPGRRTGVTRLLNDVKKAGLTVCDIETRQSSLEDIFVSLVKETT